MITTTILKPDMTDREFDIAVARVIFLETNITEKKDFLLCDEKTMIHITREKYVEEINKAYNYTENLN